MIETIFAAYGIATLVLFRLLAPSHAVAGTCFAGWLLLPVGNFPAGSTGTVFPYWITGVAIPSDMLLTKMWWPPVVALIGACLVDGARLGRTFQWRCGACGLSCSGHWSKVRTRNLGLLHFISPLRGELPGFSADFIFAATMASN